MIGTKQPNLTCVNGHRYWSPTPDAWVGKDCGRVAHDDPKTRGCKEKLGLLKTSLPHRGG